jgi:hypothetical protein
MFAENFILNLKDFSKVNLLWSANLFGLGEQFFPFFTVLFFSFKKIVVKFLFLCPQKDFERLCGLQKNVYVFDCGSSP